MRHQSHPFLLSAADTGAGIPRLTLRRSHNHTAWRARANCSVLAAAMLFVFAAGLRAQQPQTPNAAAVSPGTYDWVPYTGDNSPATIFFEHQWSPENVGSPVVNAAPTDTRRGGVGLNDDNSDAVIAGGDMFVLAEDMSGDVKQPIAMHSCDPAGTGDASYVSRYQGVLLWRLNATTGAVIAGPFRLDNHIGVCSLPHIVVTS
ncbi:MAG TPA: hypothetical protein VFH95_11580, partial [Candidatus Kapabacteria bacterium]|nr:hypothetical protein [Candidatus Kapabacteria bacterium]